MPRATAALKQPEQRRWCCAVRAALLAAWGSGSQIPAGWAALRSAALRSRVCACPVRLKRSQASPQNAPACAKSTLLQEANAAQALVKAVSEGSAAPTFSTESPGMVLGSSGVSGVLTDTLRALPAGAPTMPLAHCRANIDGPVPALSRSKTLQIG